MSNQISIEEMQRRGELLKKSKQILLQEYAAIRTQQHQQWIRDSETSWRTNGVLMAYPPGKLYPTEQEIIDKALELYNKSMVTTTVNIKDPITASNEPIIVNPGTIEPLGCDPLDVTSKLQETYNKASTPTIDYKLLGLPVSTYVEPLTNTITEQIEPVSLVEVVVEEPNIEEPNIEEPTLEDSEEIQPKHSLLRSVLSGWLSKNKDKET